MRHNHLFRHYQDCVIDPINDQDVNAKAIQKIAADNGLIVKFNMVGMGGGATVMPPHNQVNLDLFKGADNKWRLDI